MGDGDGGGSSSSSVEGNNIYKSNGKKPVLVLLSDSYLELGAILVSASKSSSCHILHYLLTTFSY